MSPEQIIADARRQGRVALDEAFRQASACESLSIPVPRGCFAKTAADAAAKVQALSPPLVAKVVSANLLHKSDVGGVRLDLSDAAAVRDAVAAMSEIAAIRSAGIDGWLVEEMAPKGAGGGDRGLPRSAVRADGDGGSRRHLRGDSAGRRVPHLPDRCRRCARHARRTQGCGSARRRPRTARQSTRPR